MPEPLKTRYFLSPQLSPRQRQAARARIVAAGVSIDQRITRNTGFVVSTAAECRAVRRDRAAGRRVPTYLTVAELRRRLPGAMVVALADGEEHELDFGSGQLRKQFPAAVAAMPPLAESEVTKARLEELLRAAGIRTSRDADDDLVAHALGESVAVIIAQDRKFVRFVKRVPVEPIISEFKRSEAVTRLNHEFDVVRFRLWDEVGICAEYAMPFAHGVIPAHIVAMLLGVSWVMKSALESEIAAELL
jgi:hypothetical protein